VFCTPPIHKGKFPVAVKVSGAISMFGATSLVVLPEGPRMTAVDYLNVLRTKHLPRVRRAFATDNRTNFVWIAVSPTRSEQPGPR
jgi:hypothetical protein